MILRELIMVVIVATYVVPVRLAGRRCHVRLHRLLARPHLIPTFVRLCWDSWRPGGAAKWTGIWK